MRNSLLFMENYGWELIPMLIAAFILGIICWAAINRNKMGSSELQKELKFLKQKNTGLQADLDKAKYERTKVEATLQGAKTKYDELELKWRAAREQLENR